MGDSTTNDALWTGSTVAPQWPPWPADKYTTIVTIVYDHKAELRKRMFRMLNDG